MKWLVNGEEVEISADPEIEVIESGDRLLVRTRAGAHSAALARSGDRTLISYRGSVYEIEKPGRQARATHVYSNGQLLSPMPGLIVEVLVSQGERVKKGQRLLILEAMKTQQPMIAPFDGTVSILKASAGMQVTESELLAVIEGEA